MKHFYIIQDLRKGYTIPDIAYKRGINKRTLEGYVDQLKKDMKANTLPQLIDKAYKMGLIKP